MCMEDITLGRRTVTHTVSRLITNNTQLFVPANGRRVGLFMSAENCTACRILRENVTAAFGQQIITDGFFAFLQTQNPWIMMRIEEFGTAVQLGYTMFNNDGSDRVLSFTEFILLE